MVSWKWISGGFINTVMTVHASSIAEYSFTLGSGITQYASANHKPQAFLNKTKDEGVKRLKVSSITELKSES